VTARARDEARRRAYGVTVEAITFWAACFPLAGVLHRPADATRPVPAVAVTGTGAACWNGWPTAMPAGSPLTTLAFDHTSCGASAGSVATTSCQR